MITAVGVAVPARDEADLIGSCLRRLRAALGRLPARVEPAVCVLADRCVDDTAPIARAACGGWPGAQVLTNERAMPLGSVRDLGCHRLVATLGAHRRAETLLLSTDADTLVDPDWALAQLHLAERGWHAIAGTAELTPPLAGPVAADYLAVRGPVHRNVYGANLGVRADAYLAVGGFGPLATGEDQDLWRRLGAAGFRRTYASEPVVRTSARRHGRAHNGLAALLHRLHTDELDLRTAS